MQFTVPTSIQQQIIPYVQSGVDCLALAPTGTGKTCAFGIPLIERIDTQVSDTQALIMCPTRELAMQIEVELKRLLKYVEGVRIMSIYGGQNFQRQLANMRKRPQIVVGTTGRVLDHLRRRTLRVDNVSMLVLDEADEMLNMGFRDDIDVIMSEIRPEAQVMMFSATMSKEIAEISNSYQKDPIRIKCEEAAEKPKIAQFFVRLKEQDKLSALRHIIDEKGYELVLVFTNTKRRASFVADKLNAAGYVADALHGDLRQSQRDSVMKRYRGGITNILVATDVAARGIDVDDIEAVFNYDVPNDDEYYLHRIGRTARAKKSGVSYTFTTANDFERIAACEKYAQSKMEEKTLEGLSDGNITAKNRLANDRLFFNVGTKDGLEADSFKQYIASKCGVAIDNIYEVKLLDTYGFVAVNPEETAKVMTLKGKKIGKRAINIELATPYRKGADAKSETHGFAKTAVRGARRAEKLSEKDFLADDKKPASKRRDYFSTFNKNTDGEAYDNKRNATSDSQEAVSQEKSFKRSSSGGNSRFGKSDGRRQFGKSDTSRGNGFKRSFEKKNADKPINDGETSTKKAEYGEKKSYTRSGETADRKRTYVKKNGNFASDGETGAKKAEYGEKKSYARSGETADRKRTFAKKSGSFAGDGETGAKKTEYGEKKSYTRSGETADRKRTFAKKSGSFASDGETSAKKAEYGEKKSYARSTDKKRVFGNVKGKSGAKHTESDSRKSKPYKVKSANVESGFETPRKKK